MKPSKCFSTNKRPIFLFVLAWTIVVFLFPGCQNSPSSGDGTVPGEVYVANMGAHSIMVYARNNNGTLADTAIRVIRGPATGLHNPFDIALDGLGRLWVANIGDPVGSNPSITVYEPDANGNAAPGFTFSATRLRDFVPNALTKSGAEEMFASGPIVPFSMSATVNHLCTMISAVIDTTSSAIGSVFSSSPSQFENPTGVALNLDTLFVSTSSLPMIVGLYTVPNPPANAIILYGRGRNGFNPVSSSMIAGNNTLLANPAHIDFDNSGNLYVLNRGVPGSSNNPPSITVYGPGQRGNTAPIRTIRGTNTELVTSNAPYGIAVDVNGFIYVSTDNRILVFASGANGNARPVDILRNTTISSNRNTDLSSPVGIAVK